MLSPSPALAAPSTPFQKACSLLTAAGLRTTRPRLAILNYLTTRARPIGSEELHEKVKKACDLVTVYRCLSAFEEIGLVRRSFHHSGTHLYTLNLGEPTRYYVVSKTTPSIEELDQDASEELRRAFSAIEEVLRSRGYTDVGHTAVVFGTPEKV